MRFEELFNDSNPLPSIGAMFRPPRDTLTFINGALGSISLVCYSTAAVGIGVGFYCKEPMLFMDSSILLVVGYACAYKLNHDV
jgi:hypothetical protein